MKLSISNIAWSNENDLEMYQFLKENEFNGIEIAPTRIFPENPYDHILEAKEYSIMLKENYGLSVSSMQSIWYGKNESIFGKDEERKTLVDYTKKAIDFAEIIGCGNIVFGCPKNRNIPSIESLPIAIEFFREIGDYAINHNVIIAIEPNPPIYNTNFINTTMEAFNICREINSAGIKVNIDLGTMIHYGEGIKEIEENIELVNHIHISEPYLQVIEPRELHKELKQLNYTKFISIEMKNMNDISLVKKIVEYVKEVFH